MQIGRLIFAAVLATLTLAYFLWKYRKAIPAFDGWRDLAHRCIKTCFAIGLILCLTGCALLSDNAAKRAELKKQLGELASSGLTSLVTGNPLPAVGGAISFIGYLFGATGAAYAIRQRHKFRQEVGPQPQGFPVLPVPGQVNGKTVLPGGQDPGAYAPNPQDINGGRVAA
jgi:hypothetical protein